LLDTLPPGTKTQANPVDRVRIHILNLKGKNLAGILKYIGTSFHTLSNRWRHRAIVKANKIEQFQKEDRDKEEMRDLLLRSYKPEPYEGKVTIFEAAERPWYMRWDPLEPWSKILIGQLDLVQIPGDHMTMLEKPQADELARKIDELLPRRNNGR